MENETKQDDRLEQAGAALGMQNAAQGFSAIREMLSAIVVLDRYTITDIYGTEYEFRPVVSARKQITAGLIIDRLVRREVSTDGLLAQAQAARESGDMVAGLVAFLNGVIGDDGVQADLDELFRVLHPKIVASAQVDAYEAGDVETQAASVLDLFELPELVQGLLPFFARSATKVADMLAGMTEAEPAPGVSSQPMQPVPSAK